MGAVSTRLRLDRWRATFQGLGSATLSPITVAAAPVEPVRRLHAIS